MCSVWLANVHRGHTFRISCLEVESVLLLVFKVRTFKELCGLSEAKQVMMNEQKVRDKDLSIGAVC